MYEKTVKLQDNESLLKLNKETGEYKELKKAIKKLDIGKELYKDEGLYFKTYQGINKFLRKNLNHVERDILSIMSEMSEYGTNSLRPLDDDMTSVELSEHFGVHRNYIKKALKNLYDIGAYGKFSVSEIDAPYKRYWILNPYITYKGKTIQTDIKELFKNTEIALWHFKVAEEENRLKKKN